MSCFRLQVAGEQSDIIPMAKGASGIFCVVRFLALLED